jgi:hypothetical protein
MNDEVDILDKLYKQLGVLDDHPDFNESCTVICVIEAIDEIKSLRQQALTQAPIIPEGWKLVPLVPTQEMLDAALEAVWSGDQNTTEQEFDRSEHCQKYKLMIAAAPELEPKPHADHIVEQK